MPNPGFNRNDPGHADIDDRFSAPDADRFVSNPVLDPVAVVAEIFFLLPSAESYSFRCADQERMEEHVFLVIILYWTYPDFGWKQGGAFRIVTIWTCSSPLDLARGPRAYMTSSARPRDVITATRTTHNDHAILPACSTTPRDALPSRAASRAWYCGPRDPAKLRPRVLGSATRPLATSRTADRTRHPLLPISTATRTLCGSTLVQTQVLAD